MGELRKKKITRKILEEMEDILTEVNGKHYFYCETRFYRITLEFCEKIKEYKYCKCPKKCKVYERVKKILGKVENA